MINLSEHEKKILHLIKKYPEILTDISKRKEIAEKVGLAEKTIRNRIADLKKIGLINDQGANSADKSDYVGENIPAFIFLTSIWKNKFTILRNVFIVSVLMISFTLILPKTYKSNCVILIPKDENSIFGGAGLLSMVSPVGLMGNMGENETMTFMSILKSRTILSDAVDEFDLIAHYQVSSMEKAVEKLSANSSFEINEEGALDIVVFTKTNWFHNDIEEQKAKELTANITNYFASKLDEVNKNLKTEKARFHREFIEKRYLQSIQLLKNTEISLEDFQQKTNLVSLSEQTRGLFETAAMLQGEIYLKDVEKSILYENYSPSHPLVLSKSREIDGLKNQLDSLNTGITSGNIFPSLSKLPALGNQYISLVRDREIQNSIYQLLVTEYENAKIQESKDTPTLQILDKAIAPEQKYKPQRGKLVIIAFLLSFLISAYFYYFKERLNQIPN